MKPPAYIWYSGQFYKLKHETINKAVYKTKDDQLKTFSHPQIKQGLTDYKREWDKEKKKNATRD